MFISNKILDWNLQIDSFHVHDSEWKIPHEGWRHAENILKNDAEKYHRIDAIATLKRAIDYRVKDLGAKYNLKGIGPEWKKKNKYEILAHFNIIKPIMLKKLLVIRNRIEHEHSAPPSLEACLELSEFVWYFLKSTDSFSQRVADSFILDESPELDNRHCFIVTPDIKNNWNLDVSGWLKNCYYSSSNQDNFFEIQNARIETFEQLKIRIGKHHTLGDYHAERADSDLHLDISSIENQEIREAFVLKYFESNSI